MKITYATNLHFARRYSEIDIEIKHSPVGIIIKTFLVPYEVFLPYRKYSTEEILNIPLFEPRENKHWVEVIYDILSEIREGSSCLFIGDLVAGIKPVMGYKAISFSHKFSPDFRFVAAYRDDAYDMVSTINVEDYLLVSPLKIENSYTHTLKVHPHGLILRIKDDLTDEVLNQWTIPFKHVLSPIDILNGDSAKDLRICDDLMSDDVWSDPSYLHKKTIGSFTYYESKGRAVGLVLGTNTALRAMKGLWDTHKGFINSKHLTEALDKDSVDGVETTIVEHVIRTHTHIENTHYRGL